MAKDRERKIARNYYVDMGKTAKEIAELLGVSQQILTKWVNDPKENWKEQRNAKISNSEISTENINKLIVGLCDDRLNLAENLKKLEAELAKTKETTAKNLLVVQISSIRKNLASIDDSVSKWNKTRVNLQKENDITFTVHMKVMEEIFNDLRAYDEKLYLKTIDFQELHLNKVAGRYK